MMRGVSSVFHSVAAVTLVALAAGSAHADNARPPAPSPENVARAEGLFKEGQVLLDAGKIEEACPRFAESQKLAPGLGVSLYLADCWERTGRVFSAHAEFKRAEAAAAARKDPRAAIAHARAATLEPLIPTMTIRVPADARVPGLEVRRDEQPLAEAEWDTAVPLDPGNHVVKMSAPGRKPREIAIAVKASDKSVVALPALDTDAQAPVAVAEPPAHLASTTTPPPQEAQASHGSTQRWIGIGVAGAGVVLVGVGAVLGLSAKSKLDDSNEPGRCNAADQCTDEGLTLRSDANGLATGSTVLVALGGAALVGGVVLYLTAPKGSTASTALTIRPGPGRAELSLGGHF